MTTLALRHLTPLLENKRALILVLCALTALAAVFPPAALGVMLILWARRSEISEGVSRAFAPDRRWYLWLPGGLIAALTVAKGGSVLLDDLARHLTAYLHGYDYNGFYLYSDPNTPHASMWFGFEWLVGHLHQWVGLFWATQIVQATAFAWAIWLFTVLFLRIMREHPERLLLTALGITAVLYSVLLERIQSGRPEVFLSLLALTALLADTKLKAALWTLGMLAAQPLYWLAIIYAPAALLLPNRTWTARIALATLIGGCGIGMWLTYAGAEWYGFFALLKVWMANRAVSVGESNSIYVLLFVPGSLVLVLVALMFSERRDVVANLPVFLVLAWFLVPNQVRYASMVSPLLAILAARGMNAHPFRMSVAQRFIAVVIVVGAIFGHMQGSGYSWLPAFKTLKGDERVLTMFDVSTYFLPAQYPGLRVAPHLEGGATERGVQDLLLDMGRNRKVNCTTLQKYPAFTHIVERNIEELTPCVELQEMHREWRLWRIKPAAPALAEGTVHHD